MERLRLRNRNRRAKMGSNGEIGARRPELDDVTLSFPAQPWALSLARLVAASLGNRLGFVLEEIDDLRLAVEEVCLILMGSPEGDGSIALSFALDHDALHLDARLDGTRASLAPTELSLQILQALVDECEISEVDRRVSISRRARAAAD